MQSSWQNVCLFTSFQSKWNVSIFNELKECRWWWRWVFFFFPPNYALSAKPHEILSHCLNCTNCIPMPYHVIVAWWGFSKRNHFTFIWTFWPIHKLYRLLEVPLFGWPKEWVFSIRSAFNLFNILTSWPKPQHWHKALKIHSIECIFRVFVPSLLNILLALWQEARLFIRQFVHKTKASKL